jgi:hypothetical protein
MMIEKYPPALEHQRVYSDLPLHVECINQCESAIISKCVERYPGALSIADEDGYLPLHWLLANKSSTVEDALMMIEKYPEALKQRNRYDLITLHVECDYQCR